MTPHLLANFRHKYYAVHVPEKKGNEFSSSTSTRRTGRAMRLFHVRYAFVRPLWAAMAGRLRPAGFLVHRSANPAICCPPRLAAGGSLTTVQGGIMPSKSTPIRLSTNNDASHGQELTIYINHEFDILEYRGTRAMLEEEGVIPVDFRWPTAYDDLRWESGKFRYWLRRHRPDGAKGSRKDFVDCDWWHLRWNLINAPDFRQSRLAKMAKALSDEIYRCSDKGRAEFCIQYERLREARKDEKFQAFKALFPSLVAPKRGRPSKTIIQQGAAA